MNRFDLLKNYKELLDAGIITEEEYDAKKVELLGAPDIKNSNKAPVKEKDDKPLIEKKPKIDKPTNGTNKKSTKPIIIVAVLLLIGAGAFLLLRGGSAVTLPADCQFAESREDAVAKISEEKGVYKEEIWSEEECVFVPYSYEGTEGDYSLTFDEQDKLICLCHTNYGDDSIALAEEIRKKYGKEDETIGSFEIWNKGDNTIAMTASEYGVKVFYCINDYYESTIKQELSNFEW